MGLAGKPMQTPHYIYGIDFSGAQDAGKKIWISKAFVDGKFLFIEHVRRTRDQLNTVNSLNQCLPALLDFIKKNMDSAFGFDFPFGLPKDLVPQGKWEDVILSFPDLYSDPDDFKEKCFSNAGNRELERQTDRDTQTPFSPYNLRIYKQTYYGIREILKPLVQNMQACVLPMQKPTPGKPWILEICPASTLKRMYLYDLQYKGTTGEHRHARWEILQGIVKAGHLLVNQPSIYRAIIEDTGGDALDSVIAAFATFRAMQKGLSPRAKNKDYMIEGYVYV